MMVDPGLALPLTLLIYNNVLTDMDLLVIFDLIMVKKRD